MGEIRITNTLFTNFGLVLSELRRQGDHYYGQKDQENFFISTIPGGQEAFKKASSLVQTVAKANLCPQPVPSLRGRLIEKVTDSQALMVFRIVGGRKIDLSWQEDRKAIINLAASWYQATLALSEMNLASSSWIDTLIKRCQSLEQLTSSLTAKAESLAGLMDVAKLQEINTYFYQQGLQTVQKMLSNVGYWRKKEFDNFWSQGYKPVLSQNFWVLPNQQLRVIDFQRLAPGWQISNLARVIDCMGRKVKWEFDEISYLIDLYESQSVISPADFQALFTLLSFPNRFYWYAGKLMDTLEKWPDSTEKMFSKKLQTGVSQLAHQINRLYLEDQLKAKFMNQWKG